MAAAAKGVEGSEEMVGEEEEDNEHGGPSSSLLLQPEFSRCSRSRQIVGEKAELERHQRTNEPEKKKKEQKEPIPNSVYRSLADPSRWTLEESQCL